MIVIPWFLLRLRPRLLAVPLLLATECTSLFGRQPQKRRKDAPQRHLPPVPSVHRGRPWRIGTEK
jgi:hypothetical protein